MLAAKAGFTSIVRILVDAGADLGIAEPEHGFSAAHMAVMFGRTEALRVLIDAGAASAPDGVGRTPLDLARLHGDAEVMGVFGGGVDGAGGRGENGGKGEGRGDGGGGKGRGIKGTREVGKVGVVVGVEGEGEGEVGHDEQQQCDIAVVDAADVTQRDFIRDFLSINRPVIVRGGVAHWPAMDRWQDGDYVRLLGGVRLGVYGGGREAGEAEEGEGSGRGGQGGEVRFPVSRIPYPEIFGLKPPRNMTLRAFLQYVDEANVDEANVDEANGSPTADRQTPPRPPRFRLRLLFHPRLPRLVFSRQHRRPVVHFSRLQGRGGLRCGRHDW